MYGCDMVVKPTHINLTIIVDSSALVLTVMPDLKYVRMTNMYDMINN
jgi:hypothetical protein